MADLRELVASRRHIQATHSRAKIEEMRQKIARCEHLEKNDDERVVGQVLVSTGIQVSNRMGCQLGAQCNQQCSENHHLQDSAIILLSSAHSTAVNTDLAHQDKASVILDNMEPPRIREPVYKVGARTGRTTGMVFPRKYETREDEVGNYTPEIEYRDWEVISDQQGVPFCMPGDSGSVVVNNRSSIIGQIHSGTDDGMRVRITHMTAIEDVVGDLQRRTPGCYLHLRRGSIVQRWIRGSPLGSLVQKCIQQLC